MAGDGGDSSVVFLDLDPSQFAGEQDEAVFDGTIEVDVFDGFGLPSRASI